LHSDKLKSDFATVKLFEWLNSDDFDVCPNAAVALVMVGGKRQVMPLIGVLKSQNAVSRGSAAYALGILNDKRAVEPLIALLTDSDIEFD
jgi:HEAT repeat protein